jgi:DNA-binding transcriptional LysR family regulator
MFDSSITMAEAAAQGAGVTLLPVAMFERDLSLGRLVQPFDIRVSIGDYGSCRSSQRPRPTRCARFVNGSLQAWDLANVEIVGRDRLR